MKHVLIVGGAGFVGQMLVRAFANRSWSITVFDVHAGKLEGDNIRYYEVDVTGGKLPTLPECHAIINLAGATINHRFTPQYKKLIWSSRVIVTRSLRQWVETQPWHPDIYIGASAVGYYGNHGDNTLTTKSKPTDDTLSQVCVDWEREHQGFRKIGIPVAVLRQGHVIGGGGMIAELLPWFRKKVHLKIGNGSNFVPFIDSRDLIALYESLATGSLRPGTYNATSPELIRMKDISRQLAKITHAFIPLRVPRWALRLRLGEYADYLYASQKVEPSREILHILEHINLAESLIHAVEITTTAV